MNFYDVNGRGDNYGRQQRHTPTNLLHQVRKNPLDGPRPIGRGFDAKKLYKDRLKDVNPTVKNKKKLDFKPVNQEIYRRRIPSPREPSTDEQPEWYAP